MEPEHLWKGRLLDRQHDKAAQRARMAAENEADRRDPVKVVARAAQANHASVDERAVASLLDRLLIMPAHTFHGIDGSRYLSIEGARVNVSEGARTVYYGTHTYRLVS